MAYHRRSLDAADIKPPLPGLKGHQSMNTIDATVLQIVVDLVIAIHATTFQPGLLNQPGLPLVLASPFG